MSVSKNKALELIDKQIQQYKSLLETQCNSLYPFKKTIIEGAKDNNSYQFVNCIAKYHEVRYSTEALLNDLFSEEEVEKFRHDVFTFIGDKSLCPYIECDGQPEDYRIHINKCISKLKAYKEKINLWEGSETIEPDKIDRLKKYNELSDKHHITIINNPQAHAEANATSKAEQNMDVDIDVNIDLKIDLPLIRKEFDNLKDELENVNPKLDSELDKIQDSLDELSTNSDKERVAKPFNKLYRLLDKMSDPNSDYNKVITGTQKGIELAQKVGRTYNKFAQWLEMPTVPDLFLGKS